MAQAESGDNVDLAALTQIKRQAFEHSQVMEYLFYLSDVHGPRVTNSTNHQAAADWAMAQMKLIGLQNIHLERWGPFGDGWQVKKFYGALETPSYQPLIGFPLAWTPGTNGTVTGDAVLAPIHSEADFAKYKGKLRGKIVLIAEPMPLPLHLEPEARRLTDAEIAARASISDPSRLTTRRATTASAANTQEWNAATFQDISARGTTIRNR
jgi:carboxypeptidase Q